MYVIFSCPASGTRFTQSQPKRCGKLGTLFNLQRQCILSRGLTLRPGRVPKEDSGRKRFRRPLRGHVTSLQPGCHDVILARRRLLTLLTSSFSALCARLRLVPSALPLPGALCVPPSHSVSSQLGHRLCLADAEMALSLTSSALVVSAPAQSRA